MTTPMDDTTGNVSNDPLTNQPINQSPTCPAEGLMKRLSGKWKLQIFQQAIGGALRFNSLLRQLPGASKQALAVALRELEEEGLLDKQVIAAKPLHVEYTLTEKGRSLIPVFEMLENMAVNG